MSLNRNTQNKGIYWLRDKNGVTIQGSLTLCLQWLQNTTAANNENLLCVCLRFPDAYAIVLFCGVSSKILTIHYLLLMKEVSAYLNFMRARKMLPIEAGRGLRNTKIGVICWLPLRCLNVRQIDQRSKLITEVGSSLFRGTWPAPPVSTAIPGPHQCPGP